MKTKRACVIDATGRKHCGRLVGASRGNPAAKRSRASAGKTSLGARLVELGNPAAASDVRMLGLGPTASLDEVCYALAGTGLYSADALRINALRALALKVEDDFDKVEPALRWLDRLQVRLCVWSAASIAREVLPLVPAGDKSARAAIHATEAWVAGIGTTAQARLASIEAYEAGSRAYRAATDPRASSSDETQDKLFAAGNAVLAASHAASMISGGTSGALGLTVDTALMAMRMQGDVDSTADARSVERRLLTAMLDRLPLFPVWQGAPAEDAWPMTTAGRSL
jgi:hypothetical protein